MQAIIEEAGGDAGKVSVSYATTDRSRRMINEDIATEVRKSWVPPRYASLHWDSKLMMSQTTRDLQEILVVSVGDLMSRFLACQLINQEQISDLENIITRATMQLLQSWNCVDSIVNMTFDTTTSNTGHVSAELCDPAAQHWPCIALVCIPSSCWGSNFDTRL